MTTASHNGVPPDAAVGRRFIIALIVLNALLALSVILLAAATGNFDRLPRLLFRLAVNGFLMYGLWSGVRWIKWLFVLGLFLSGVLVLFAPFTFPGPPGLIAFALSAALIWAAWHLAFGASVNRFFEYQRGELSVGGEPPPPYPDG